MLGHKTWKNDSYLRHSSGASSELSPQLSTVLQTLSLEVHFVLEAQAN